MLRSANVIAVFVLASLVHAAPLVAAQDAPTHVITGIVVDDQGNPVAGATVYGWTSSSDGAASSSDKNQTGEDGAFTLRLSNGKGYLQATHEKFPRGATLELAVDGDASGLRLVLPTPPPRNAIVEGTITGPNGEPVEGATVTISQGCCYIYEATPTPAGDAPASDEPAPDASGGGGSSGSSAGMTRPAIWPGPGGEYDHQSFVTKADGKYRFETYAGPRVVTATAKGHAQTQAELTAVDGQTTTVDLKLEKVPAVDATLIIKVVDARTGAPLGNAQVSVQNVEWSRYGWIQTGADGSGKVTTLPGWTHVSVSYYEYAVAEDVAVGVVAEKMMAASGGGRQYYAYTSALRLASGEQTLEVRLEPKPEATIVLTGYVVDPETKTGVPDAQVSIWNQDTGDWGSATTDATGSYKLLVRPGHYTMNAWAPKHLSGVETFTIAAGETTKRVDIETPAGETRYAPCDEGCPEPYPMYDLAAKGMTTGAPSMATAEGDARLDEAQSPGTGADTTRAATYQGSGGGLPPYDAASAPADDGTVPAASEVPGFGAALLVAAALGAALVVARRRG